MLIKVLWAIDHAGGGSPAPGWVTWLKGWAVEVTGLAGWLGLCSEM